MENREKRIKHPVLMVAGILLLALLGAGALFYVFQEPLVFSRRIGFRYSQTQVLDSYDSHGWPGEGETTMTLRATDRQKKYIEENWRPLSMSDAMSATVFGFDGTRRFYRTRDTRSFFPEIEEGAYLYLVRNPDKADYEEQEELVPAEHEILLIYDAEEGLLYYFKNDR